MTSTLKVQNIAHTGGTNAIAIDSSGRVTTPQLIAFSGQKTNGSGYSTTGVIPFNQTHLAHASWNGSTFTAPIAGTYMFTLVGHHQSISNAGFELAIYKNGAFAISGYALNSADNTRQRVQTTYLQALSVNDTIDFRLNQGDVWDGAQSGVSCTGHLIG